jgi:tRNA pseudouridine-54 N-methylase
MKCVLKTPWRISSGFKAGQFKAFPRRQVLSFVLVGQKSTCSIHLSRNTAGLVLKVHLVDLVGFLCRFGMFATCRAQNFFWSTKTHHHDFNCSIHVSRNTAGLVLKVHLVDLVGFLCMFGMFATCRAQNFFWSTKTHHSK